MNSNKTRWIIYSTLLIVVVLSYLLGINLITHPSPEVQKSYTFIENLPESSVVMVSFDHEASSLPEIQPISLILLRHLFRRNLRVVGLSLFAEGTAIGYRTLTKVAQEYGKQYGHDYVFLGFKPQHISAILGMGESIRGVFPEDYFGNKIEEIPLMRKIRNYDDILVVISIADGDRTMQWIEYAGAKYHQRIMAGLTAAMITTYDPYLASGQLSSAVGGLKGAAEYENLYGRRGMGNRGMVAQTAAHIFIIVLIVIGNILYFKNRSKGGGNR
ncbi:MAG: hypothetical protein NTV06_06110 [candidate division Zixibacteria bacterium]|nr:hypothetical protein [candidate division Zixibacteria bacterium]